MAEPSAKENCIEDCEVLLGNSNNRFSGVTSTMLQTLEYQKREMNIRVLGAHNLNDTSLAITFKDAALRLRIPLKSGKYRVFHARRNNEMLQALILKQLLSHTTSHEIISGYQSWKKEMGGVLAPIDVSNAISYAYNQPQNVCLREIVLAPTKQQP